ncbi:MAG: ROK family protein [Verrucomicrobiota bacterium]
MFLGCEIGGTKLQVGVVSGRGQLRHLVRLPVDRAAGRAGILRQFIEVIPAIVLDNPVQAIGVGFGGPVDGWQGRVVQSFQVGGWRGFELRRWFARQFQLPVAVENDSNCAALAEARCGAGRGQRVVFYTNIGTGIGGGLVINGQLYNGRFGAMEIGHMRWPVGGRWPMVEDLASGLAIEHGQSTVAQSARVMGVAVANVIALLNPDVVVVGGGVAQAGGKFFRPLRATVRRLVFGPFRGNYRIVPAAVGEPVVVVGAALVAAELVAHRR